MGERIVKVRTTAKAADTPDRSASDGAPLPGNAAPAGLARIGKYEVKSEIGKGTRIKVFSGTDPLTGRPVTLKLLLDITDAAISERFKAEITAAARISSAEFASIYELGEHVGFKFVAMQCAGDDDMRRVLKRMRFLSLLQRVSIMWDVAEGAIAAHSSGLSYIGIRPSAIAITDREHGLISDFGIVRLSPEDETERVAYASPEESAATAPDVLSDVFAFGVLYYQILTGNHPFLNENGELDRERRPAPICQSAPDCPDVLEQVIRRAMETDRASRYQSFEELQEEAKPVLRDLRRGRAAAVTEQARALLISGDTEGAQNAVREAVELDPDNAGAERLRAEIRNLLKRQMTAQQVDAVIKRAELASAAADYDQAIRILDSAQGAEIGDWDACTRLASVRRRLEATCEAARLTAEARKHKGQGGYAEARAAVSSALAADPGYQPAVALCAEIEELAEREEQEAKVDQALVQAKALLLIESFDEALAGLKRVNLECPGFEVLGQWIERIESQKAAAESKTRMEVTLVAIRGLLDNGRFGEAIAKLELVASQYPQAEVGDLIAQARESKERADAVDQVLLDAAWLTDNKRPDLAMQLMREKEPELGSDARFAARLQQIASALSKWEQRRAIEDCLRQAAALENNGQWAVALTVLEEALSVTPGAEELLREANRVRGQIRQDERAQRLQHRVKAISRKLSAREWQQALALLEAARREFPEEAELNSLEDEARAAQRAAECVSVAAEVRQLMADGEVEQAEVLLRSSLERAPGETVLSELVSELESAKRYRVDWRHAQVLFGRRQFEEAETILARLAERQRPEVDLLLDLVRERRTAHEEEDFYRRGIDKANKLIEAGHFDQAADLLRNLLSLFPGDVILEKQFRLAKRSLAHGPRNENPAPSDATPDELTPARETGAEPEAVLAGPSFQLSFEGEKKKRPWLAIAVAAGLAASLGGVLWNRSNLSAPAPKAAAPKPVASATVKADAPPPQGAVEPKSIAPAKAVRYTDPPDPEDREPVKAARQLRAFNPASLPVTKQQPAQLAAPPSAPAAATNSGGMTIPPALLEIARPVAEAPASAQEQRKTQVSSLRPAAVVSRVLPQTPPLAARSGVFGPVELEATIDQKGVVTAVKIVSGNALLSAAAKDAVLKWRYDPAVLNGQPIESRQAIRIMFQKPQ
jgi:TonB family protein